MLPVIVEGEVTRFKGNGRQLGYPTANLSIKTDLADGVYFGHADLGELSDHPALIFVGVPTAVGDKQRRVEAHLLDIPDKDYYGQKLKLRVEKFHRANQTFENVTDLREVMKDDEAQGRRWFEQSLVANEPRMKDN